jgi:hypothetical protein
MQTFCYNHGAIDPNGDSLAYSLVNPATSGPGTSVTWIPPNHAGQPFLSVPALTLNPVTGDICMTPFLLARSPLAVKVEKWRSVNGITQLVGTIIRDMQINVINCNNQLPQLSGIDTTQVKGYDPNDTIRYMEVCLGDSVAFAIWGFDADLPDTNSLGYPNLFNIVWNSGIPQGSFQSFHNYTDSAFAIFRWLPTASDMGNTPRCFTATIQDAACPYNGIQAFSYCFVVRGAFADIGSDTLICQGEVITFDAVVDSSTVNYLWTIDGLPAGVPSTSGSLTL